MHGIYFVKDLDDPVGVKMRLFGVVKYEALAIDFTSAI